MGTAAAVLAAVLLLSAWVSRVNARYESRKRDAPASADDLVAAAWEEFGGDDDLAASQAAFDALYAGAPAEALASKTSLVRVAVMALRAERHEVLGALAERAAVVAGGTCGETRALAVLAAAYGGDVERARVLHARSMEAMSGCASCGAEASVKILMQEVSLVLDALATPASDTLAVRDLRGAP